MSITMKALNHENIIENFRRNVHGISQKELRSLQHAFADATWSSFPTTTASIAILRVFGFQDEANAFREEIIEEKDNSLIADVNNDLFLLLSEAAEDDYHTTPHDPLLDIKPEQLRDVIADVARESINMALKRQMTALTGRLYD